MHTANSMNLGPPFVVLGANDEEIQQAHIKVQAEWVLNPDWQQGMGSSLLAGLKAVLRKNPALEAIMILLADQPLITTEYLESMILAFRQKKVSLVATQYPEGPGVPALMGRSLFNELLQLQGDQGARKILIKYADKALILQNEQGTLDIDSPEDYHNLKNLE